MAIPSTLLYWHKLESESQPQIGPTTTWNGTSAFATAKFNNGGRSNSSSYATFPIESIWPDVASASNGCAEFWFKPLVDSSVWPLSGAVGQYIISNGATGDGALSVRIRRAASVVRIYFEIAGISLTSAIISFTAGDLIHFAFSWSYDSIYSTIIGEIFQNNVSIANGVTSADLYLNPTMYLFSDNGPTYFLSSGLIDNLKIWNYYKTDFSDRDTEGYTGYPDNVTSFNAVQGTSSGVIDLSWVEPTSTSSFDGVMIRRDTSALVDTSSGTLVIQTSVGIQPVLWNKLEGDAGGGVVTSEIGGNGTIGGTPTFATCKFNNGFKSNAAWDYVLFSSLKNGQLIDEWFSQDGGAIEFWAKPAYNLSSGNMDTASQAYFFGFSNGYSAFLDVGQSGRGLRLNFGDLVCQTGSSVSWSSGDLFHIACVWSRSGAITGGKNIAIFMDGNIVASTTGLVQAVVPVTDLYIGSNNGEIPLTPSLSYIDNLKCWNYAKENYNDRFVEGVPEVITSYLDTGLNDETDYYYGAFSYVNTSSGKFYAPLLESTPQFLKPADFSAPNVVNTSTSLVYPVLWSKLESTISEIGDNATSTGIPVWAAGKFNNGINATSDVNYISYPGTSFNLNESCIEFWAKPSWASTSAFIHTAFIGNAGGIKIEVDNGNFRFLCGGVTITCAVNSWAANDLVHFGLVVSKSKAISGGKSLAIYQNGVEIGSSTGLIVDRADSAITVGTRLIAPKCRWLGVIDNLKVWDYPKVDFSDRNIEGYSSFPVKVVWVNPTDDPDFAGVRVVRKSSGIPAWSENYTDGTVLLQTSAGETTYLDTTAPINRDIYYSIFGFDVHYNYGGANPGMRSEIIPALIPSVSNATLAEGNPAGSIKISWTEPPTDFDGVRIRRSTSPIANVTDGVQVADVISGITSYTDSGLNTSTSYYYRLFSYFEIASVRYYDSGVDSTPSALSPSGTIIYISTSGSNISPYRTPATATSDISSAISVSGFGDTILFLDSEIYTFNSTITISAASLTITSSTGVLPEINVYGSNATNQGFSLNADGIVFNKLKFTDFSIPLMDVAQIIIGNNKANIAIRNCTLNCDVDLFKDFGNNAIIDNTLILNGKNIYGSNTLSGNISGLTVSNTQINTCFSYGIFISAVSYSYNNILIKNTSINGNGSSQAIYIGDNVSNVTIENCTTHNHDRGFRQANNLGSNIQIKNCIYFNNTTDVSDDTYSSTAIDVKYSMLDSVEGNVTRSNCISTSGLSLISSDPLNSDYLKSNTGCTSIDAGDPTSNYSNEPEPNGNRINLGVWGNTVYATESSPPENVSNFTANQGFSNGVIILNWVEPSQYSYRGVRIRRDTSPLSLVTDGSQVIDASTGITQYIDSGLDEELGYYYRAFSYESTSTGFSSGINSDPSPRKPADYNPPTVTSTSFTVTYTSSGYTTVPQPLITWINAAPDHAGALIVRKIGSYSTSTGDGILLYTTSAGQTSYLDTTALLETTYWYSVFAFDEVPNYSGTNPGMRVEVMLADDTPANVSNFNATQGILNGEINLAWTEPLAGYTGVRIRRDIIPLTNRITGIQIGDFTVGTTSIVDSGLDEETFYYYKGFSYYTSSGHVYFSDGIESTPQSLKPKDTTAPTVTNVRASVTVSSTGIITVYDSYPHLTWVNPVAPDFVGVIIIRKTSSYSTSHTDGTVLLNTTSHQESFIDSTTVLGILYYYSIFAYDEVPNYSAVSSDMRASVIAYPVISPPSNEGLFGEIIQVEI